MVCRIIVFVCFISVYAEEEELSYKLSMVASNMNPTRPAVFNHAESPLWDHDTQSLYFVDVHKQNIHRLDYVTGKIDTKHIAYGQVNVVSLVADSRRLLVAVRSSLFLLDWHKPGDSGLRLLTTVDMGMPNNVINEGKPDSEGRFWMGTKGPQIGDDVVPDKATLYSVQQETFTTPRIQLRPVSISNGMAWSLNNTILYYTDSSTQLIEAFDFDALKGDLSGRRTIIDVTNYGFNDAIPDGLTIDTQGNLWVALMFGGYVLHIDPDARQIIHKYEIPVAHTTSVCWGGPNLDELFVTTGQEPTESGVVEKNIKKKAIQGALFTIRNTGSRGLKPKYFKFDNADYY